MGEAWYKKHNLKESNRSRHLKKWTKDELEWLTDNYNELPVDKLIKHLGRTSKAICDKARVLKIVKKTPPIINGKKVCIRCGLNLDVNQFHNGLKSISGLRGDCKNCVRDRGFQRKYGITLNDYKVMLKEQGGRCKICGENEARLHLDHCHSTGVVRGILCEHCNRGLGCFKDNIDNLIKAMEYLENASS
jgi:hypothetical protein